MRLCALSLAALLTALIATLAPAEMACCAGLAAPHGSECCADSDDDALARSCCSGAQSSERVRTGSPAALQPAAPASSLARLLSRAPAALSLYPARSGAAPTARLYQLHASLLL